MKVQGNSVRWWVWALAFLSAALLAAFFLSLSPNRESADPPDTAAAPLVEGASPPPETGSGAWIDEETPAFAETAPRQPEKRPPSADEMEYAIPEFTDPLMVRLASRPSLGPISVERYDSDGLPTGEPLRRGTQVQIPDPDRPGAKIYFRVP